MKQVLIITMAFSILSTSCNGPKKMTASTPQDNTGYNTPLTDVFWVPTEVNGKAMVQTPNDKIMHTRFNSKENRVEGNGGCNTMFGKYELSANERIKISIGSTRMACAGKMEMESNFFKALTDADSYLIKSDTLQLFSAEKTLLARLVAKHLPR